MLTCQIRQDSAQSSAPDSDGATLTVIGERQTILFDGSPADATAHLRNLPIGLPVEARFYRDGAFAGLRSCMNKPTLWADVETRA